MALAIKFRSVDCSIDRERQPPNYQACRMTLCHHCGLDTYITRPRAKPKAQRVGVLLHLFNIIQQKTKNQTAKGTFFEFLDLFGIFIGFSEGASTRLTTPSVTLHASPPGSCTFLGHLFAQRNRDRLMREERKNMEHHGRTLHGLTQGLGQGPIGYPTTRTSPRL